MKVYDASVLIAVFLENDSQHEEGLNLFTQETEQIHIPYCIFTEIVSVLTYKGNKMLAEQFVEYIYSDERILIDPPSIHEEVSFWKNFVIGKISFNDSVAIFAAIKNKCPLVTFDEQMKKVHQKLA